MRSTQPRTHPGSIPCDLITGTAAGTYASQTFPLVNPGGLHRLFLVFPNANTYSLNWVEFVGSGVGTP